MRFLAVYRFIRPKTLYIIVVENVLNSSIRVHDVYDLKGRQPKPGKYKRNKEGTGKVLKDNDLDRRFYLGEKRKAFVEQLQADVNVSSLSSFFLLPSSFFLLTSSFFLLPSSPPLFEPCLLLL
jgi:hypothetical protein